MNNALRKGNRSGATRLVNIRWRLLLLTLLTMLPVLAQAQNALTYMTNNGAITITGYVGPSGGVTNVVVPAIINGYAVASIGDSAFSSCSRLTNAVIPNSMTSIGDYAFYNSGLTSLVIPNSVANIGDYSFGSCTSLTNITVDAANTAYSSVNGVLFNKSQTTLIAFPAGIHGSYAVPGSVTSIGDRAFAFCSGLTSVLIPNNVTNIEPGAFVYCSSLTSVAVPNNVTRIGELAFANCFGLTNVVIPDSVTSIGVSAFANCHSLTDVVIPNSVTSIGENTFGGCSVLTSVVIPDSVRSIGDTAFSWCFGLTNVVIGNSVTSIGVNAFWSCEGLTSVSIPNSVTSIGVAAFAACRSLTNITVDAANAAYSSANGVLFNKMQTTLITFPAGVGGSYVVPGSVTSIEASAFRSCSVLTSVVIPNSVTSVGDNAFAGCAGLTSVAIPNSVTSIGDYSFGGCTSLTSVAIPNSVTSIGVWAFSFCSGLTCVVIPNSMTSIGDYAFAGCYHLTNITFLGNAPALLGSLVFNGVAAGAKVYYYYGTTGWGPAYGGLPTLMLYWPPRIGDGDGNVAIQSGKFGFTISGVANQSVVVEASTNLESWQPIWTNTLSSASTNFTDPQWSNYPKRFYRVRN